MSDKHRLGLLEYLRSLQLFPPGDTASNLHPGDKGGDPQEQHGSIKLPVLFQIPEYGDE